MTGMGKTLLMMGMRGDSLLCVVLVASHYVGFLGVDRCDENGWDGHI